MECMGGTALIGAVKYVCEVRGGRQGGRGGGGSVCVCGCDCVGVGVIAWVRKEVCGWDSLDCCLKLCTCMCVSGEVKGECMCGWVGVTVWMWV